MLTAEFFAPRSICIVGASDDPSRIGGRAIRYCKKLGFTGTLYPINRTRSSVQGLPAFHSLADLPAVADLCIISIDKQYVLSTVSQAAELGTKNFVVFSSGFAETGASEDRLLQEQLRDLCTARDLLLLGPNSIGFMNVSEGIYATFSQVLDVYDPLKGPVAIVMQSGAMAAHLLTMLVKHELGACHVVATGNEVGIRVEDVLLALAECPNCSVVAVGVETLRKGRSLVEAIDRLTRAGKAVVFLKIGSSESGSLAVRSHSAGISGDARLIEGILEARGVYISRSLTGVLRTVEALARQRRVVPIRDSGGKNDGDRLAIISHSGGFGILMADAAERAGLRVLALEEGVQAALKKRLGVQTILNPVDVTGQVLNDPGRLRFALEAVAASPGIDGIALFLGVLGVNPGYTKERNVFFECVKEIVKNKPVGLAAILSFEDQRMLKNAGVILREDATEAIEDLAIALKARNNTWKLNGIGGIQQLDSRASEWWGIGDSDNQDSEFEVYAASDGMRYMSERHFPVVASVRVCSENDAAAAQRQLGGLVAMKVIAPGILHKRELGLVHLNIYDETQARSAFQALLLKIRNCRSLSSGAEVRVFRQVTEGVEVFVGFKRNSPVGPIILTGSGGSHVELHQDVMYEIAPTSAIAVETMLTRTRVSRLLNGYREPEPYDRRALVDFLVSFSKVAVDDGDLMEADLNPVIVKKGRDGLVILDAKIMVKAKDTAAK